MANWTALNIEPDDQSDDEVDNTKEIQIEDAVKQYQAALKLHSQGPAEYEKAALAYSKLFQSEIFKYPESETEFLRIYNHPELELSDPSYGLPLDLAAAGGDAQALPQILHITYKNHGQFILDCVKNRMKEEEMPQEALDYQNVAAIENFGLALASDESDTELWRRTARIASALGSRRIARYCLEAAVEVDDDPTVAEVDPQSLEEGFAGEELKEQLKVLSDDISLSHPIMGPFLKKTMPKFLAAHMDPYPFLRNTTKSLASVRPAIPDAQDNQIHLDYRSWTLLGQKLSAPYFSPEHSIFLDNGVARVTIKLPAEVAPSIEENNHQEALPAEDQIMQDVEITKSPTVEPGLASEPAPTATVLEPADDQPLEIVTTITTVPVTDSPRQSSVSLPTRKRSQSAANIRDTPDEENGTQKRSKRIKNRDSTLDGPIDLATQYAEQLNAFVAADEEVFTFVGGLLNKMGVDDLGTLSEVQAALSSTQNSDVAERPADMAVRDLHDSLGDLDEYLALAFTNTGAADILGSEPAGSNARLAAFLHAANSAPQKFSSFPPFNDEEGLAAFVEDVSKKWLPLPDVAYEWMCTILRTYRNVLWPNHLKVAIVHFISYGDAEVLARTEYELNLARSNGEDLQQLEERVQTLFELHIDIYSLLSNPVSTVPFDTRLVTKDRLDRWAILALDVMQYRWRVSQVKDELWLRYVWASGFYATISDNVSREHKILCWTDLQAEARESNLPSIDLPNNAVMPEISVDAADREVTKLTTMELFFNLFRVDKPDPVGIIETLEPLLDPESACQPNEEGSSDPAIPLGPPDGAQSSLLEMRKFLDAGGMPLRLFLWQRLREAYTTIGYNTKVFSCHLKTLETLVASLRTPDYVNSTDKTRRESLLQCLKTLDDVLVKALTSALNDAATCFEVIDERHLKSTCAAIAQLNRILHAAAIFDDEVRVGMTTLPQTPIYGPNGSFHMIMNKCREMQVRAWALQYCMVKEAMSQSPEIYTNPEEDQAKFLAYVHYSLGMQKICKSSNKIFLKMMKVEILRMKKLPQWEDYLGQVLFDLYGLRLGVGTFLLEDHGCPVETLDRRTVLSIADRVIALANDILLKDLVKHELRQAIERMQTAVGQAKTTHQMAHNLRNYTEYLKTSIRPINLRKAWLGQVMVDSLPVSNTESLLAAAEWYFLLGMISLTKFRSQKRLGPGSQIEDLRIGATFLRLQLQYTADKWETWYRLAQCFDLELEEEVLWTADKINNHRSDLVRLQRSAIHCYVMALSTAMRFADDSFTTAKKLSEMYYDFGMRIYASSREPFNMEAFWVDEFEKHMSGAAGMYKTPLHEELSRWKAWKYAAKLFRESLKDRPNYWVNYFMLGKCLWKLFCKDDDGANPVPGNALKRPSIESILSAFVNAISTVPKPSSRQEPILEPHYKLVSIVHKLVVMRAMEPQAAATLLQQQPYAINKGEDIAIETPEDWEPFVLKYLRGLRSADKPHWHHRMIARVASILYDENNPDYVAANDAKLEWRESIFTKTMHIVVWKPDAERPGRHCVYMERYVRKMIDILFFVNDKTNMEALVKRVRKKAPELQRFTHLWMDCCNAYIRLIRRSSGVEAGCDEVFKGVSADEFESVSKRLENWIAESTSTHPALEALREASELRRLNQGAMKVAPIDDLVNDVWAKLFVEVGRTLPGPDPASSLQGSQTDGAMDLGGNRMSLNNVLDVNAPVPVEVVGAAPRARKAGVSRKEVLKHAEAAVQRMPEPIREKVVGGGGSGRKGAGTEPPSPTVVETGGKGSGTVSGEGSGRSSATPRPGNTATQSEGGGEGDADRDGDTRMEDRDKDHDENGDHDHDAAGDGGEHVDEAEVEVEGEAEAEESERGSVHDSADDESDLSTVPDMDEDEVFPHGLGGGTTQEEHSEEHSEGEGEEDGDGDGDGEEEGDGEGEEVEHSDDGTVDEEVEES